MRGAPDDNARRLINRLLSEAERVRCDSGKMSPYDFVLRHGYVYEPSRLPENEKLQMHMQCFKNSLRLAKRRSSPWIYCEGYAWGACSGPLIHAWVTDGEGHAIDNTWDPPGLAYAGVPFRLSFAKKHMKQGDVIVSLIDDYVNGYPLLTTFAHQADKWLDVRGKGIASLNDLVTVPQAWSPAEE